MSSKNSRSSAGKNSPNPEKPQPSRRLPVRPDLTQLKHQAKDLLRSIKANDHDAISDLNRYHHRPVDPVTCKLSDAQLVLARSYGASSWRRLVQSCQLIDAIWRDDLTAVRNLITRNASLLHENAGILNANWGPPMSYAANLGRNDLVRMLHDLGARDHIHALDRAALQSKIDTAILLHDLSGAPPTPNAALGGPAYTLSVSGTIFMLERGSHVVDANGKQVAPVDVVLETDSRDPEAKHQILELYVKFGATLPDTPTMALHRGRIDLLEEHLRRDPKLLQRTFTHEEIYPPELRCHDDILATQGTPLAGTSLLHMCVDYDEFEIAEWLLKQGIDVNIRAAIDDEGFGGHTPLFSTVVSQPNFWMNYKSLPQGAPFTRLLLDHGADPNIRASLRKKLHPGYAPRYDVETVYEYRNVTALSWGRRFHAKVFVSEPALRMIEEAGGLE